jgi:hypothetical protein
VLRREKVAGDWRNVNDGDLNDLFPSSYFGVITCLMIYSCVNKGSVSTITHLIRDIPATFLGCKTFTGSL